MSLHTKKTFWLDFFWLFFIFSSIYFLFLGNRPFATPDEARYVEIPREMLFSGDWITPRLNGVKYFEKPPLLYWVEAIFQRLFGLNEFAMRVPIVFFGLSGILATYVFAQKFFSRRIALLAASIIGTSCIYFTLSRLIILDMAVSTFITLALFCFYAAVREYENIARRRLYYFLFTLCCVGGVLTKGLVALLIPGAIMVIWATVTRQWARVFPAYLPSNIFVLLALTAPWHILATLKTPDFAHKYFVVEHYLRYTTQLHLRYKPFWFFIPIAIGAFMPWGFLVLRLFKNALRYRHNTCIAYLGIWALFVLVFFSISQSKLIPYILPLFAPTAILFAHMLDNFMEENSYSKKWFPEITLCAGIVVVIGFFAKKLFPELTADKVMLMPFIYMLMACFGGFIVFSLPLFRVRQQIVGMLFTSFCVLCVLIPASPHIQRPSLKDLAQTVLAQKQPTDQIASYRAYFQDLPVYTNQVVTVVDATGELEYGTKIEDTSSWMMTTQAFHALVSARKNQFFIFLRNDAYHDLMRDYPAFAHHVVAREANVLVIKTQ